MTQPIVAITGGNSGNGLAISQLFLNEGYKVAILARSESSLLQFKQQDPNNIFTLVGDVTNTCDIEKFYFQCTQLWGGIDTVIANAGIAMPESIQEVTEKTINTSIDLNFKGVFFTVQKSLRHLNKQASIILVSSIQAQKGVGVWSVYGATKAAVRSMARSFAQELGPQGVRVNALSPGVTNTPIFLEKFGFAPQDLSEILQ